MTPEAQAKLLRVLQDGMVEPVGSHAALKVDVRIVAATNRDVRAEIAAGRFREDLYYRLEVVEIRLPPLRERRAEIPLLAVSLIGRINQRVERPRRLSKSALARLEAHDWPGNVRELSNVLERSVLYSRSEVIEADELRITAARRPPDARLPEPAEGFSLEAYLAEVRAQLIGRALEKTGGNQSAAAALLGISRQAVNKFVQDSSGNAG